MADHGRLLVDLLGHEVAVLSPCRPCTLVDRGHLDRIARSPGGLRSVVGFPRTACAFSTAQIAILQIADAVGERRERQRVGAEEHLALAIADGERASRAGRRPSGPASPVEDERRARRRLRACRQRRPAAASCGFRPCPVEIARSSGAPPTSVSVWVSKLRSPRRRQFLAQFAEVLDDAVVDDVDGPCANGVGMGVRHRRSRHGSPSGCGRCRHGPGDRLLGGSDLDRLPESLPLTARRRVA